MRILAEVLQLRDALLLVAQVVGLDLFCHHSGLRHWSWRRHGPAKTCQVEFGRSELPDQLDDGWPESEKDVFQAALRMVVVKDSR